MYSYDGNGMRYKKEVNGVKTEYYYNDTKLIMENHDGARIYFVYGPTGVEGFFDEWSTPSEYGMIKYTNISPGEYKLKIRAILLDNNQLLEERDISILASLS